jgi:NAD(P)-dependent dehydrogenase (short-subunit alcohol dehydrogenase family)
LAYGGPTNLIPLILTQKQGGRGIGQHTGFSLAEAGAEVIVFADLNEESAISTAEESKQYASNKNYRAASIKADVTKADEVQNMVDFVVREFGRLDYCVNSAGVSRRQTYTHVSDSAND